MKKPTIREIVVENKQRFLDLKNAGTVTPKALYQIAVELGFNSQARFPKFKLALQAVCGISYDVVKEVKAEQATAELSAQVTHELTLYTDFKSRTDKWAILDGAKNVVGFGKSFENLEQSAGELFAALKALDVAASARRNSNLKAIRLNLLVDAQWLTTLSGKAAVLASTAMRFGIELNIKWIRGTSNPADEFTVASGFQKIEWSETAALVFEIGAKPILEEIETKMESPIDSPTQKFTAPAAPVFTAENKQTDREAWFEAHKTEWPALRDAWKAQGFTNKQRQELLEPMIVNWAKSNQSVAV